MKNAIYVKGILGILCLLSGGLFVFKVAPTFTLPLTILFVGAIIGFFGIDELCTDKKATGYLMICLGAVVAINSIYMFFAH